MQLFVRKITGGTVAINVDPRDAVKSIYLKINDCEVEGELPHQRLIYVGQILKNDHTLSDYNVKPGSTIFHSLILRGGAITLMVKLVSEGAKNITVQVEPTDTIRSLKKKIREKVNVPVDNQHLIFATSPLDDDAKISDYELQNGSTIHLIVRMVGG